MKYHVQYDQLNHTGQHKDNYRSFRPSPASRAPFTSSMRNCRALRAPAHHRRFATLFHVQALIGVFLPRGSSLPPLHPSPPPHSRKPVRAESSRNTWYTLAVPSCVEGGQDNIVQTLIKGVVSQDECFLRHIRLIFVICYVRWWFSTILVATVVILNCKLFECIWIICLVWKSFQKPSLEDTILPRIVSRLSWKNHTGKPPIWHVPIGGCFLDPMRFRHSQKSTNDREENYCELGDKIIEARQKFTIKITAAQKLGVLIIF